MVEPQTVSEVLARLAKQGYTEDFKAHKNGLWAFPKNCELDPEQLVVDKFYRFEGETNLDDEELLFALSCPSKKIKGTYLVAFGPKMDPADAQMVQRLKHQYKNNHH
ncbi:MAG TPA: phosphoribosylpyrophosphate synthetase [Myxococcota bacterium]|nr:phosphoribosylpyrophosphate synthetase [Myxococcota bacterium]